MPKIAVILPLMVCLLTFGRRTGSWPSPFNDMPRRWDQQSADHSYEDLAEVLSEDDETMNNEDRPGDEDNNQYEYHDDGESETNTINSGDGEVCMTRECLLAAARLQTSLDESVHPCQDFYQFACGGWLKENVMPPDKGRWGQFNVGHKKLIDKLRGLFEEPPDDKHPAVRKVIQLYHACTNEKDRERVGYSGFQELLFKPYPWPMLSREWNPHHYDWKKHLSYLTREFGTTYLINMVVYLDSKDTRKRALLFDSPSFGMGRKQLLKPDIDKNVTIKAYKNFMRRMIAEIGRKLTRNNEFKPKESEIDDIIKFEQRIAQITSDPIRFRDQFALYGEGRISPDQFEKKYGLKIVDILRDTFSKTQINMNGAKKAVIVYDKLYYRNFTRLISERPSDKLKRTIANYLNWRVVKDLAVYTTKEMKNLVFEYNKEVNPELKDQTPIWEYCIDIVNSYMPYALGRLYSDVYFTESDKKDTLMMIKHIRNAFDQLLDENRWMDPETKRQAKIKLHYMINAIGYPDLIKDDRKLNHFYLNLPDIDERNYFKSVVAVNAYQINKGFNKLDLVSHNRSELDWSKGPAFVNAFFTPNLNRITFPAGILQPPFYHFGAPMEINVGGVGGIIGHEITHSFDDKGSQFDEYGNLYLWWKKQTKQEFEKKKACFVQQYSSYFDHIANMSVNGNLTIGENIADNGGLREAYRALQLYYKNGGRRMRLPGSMAKYTGEQLLFISFAHIWCSHITKQKLIETILYNSHSPSRYRVIGPVSNSYEFARTWNCPRGAPMNPTKKCVLW